jgi:hypothetical protein
MLLNLVFALALGKACFAHGGHGDHGQKPVVDENASWMTKHMAGLSCLTPACTVAPQ